MEESGIFEQTSDSSLLLLDTRLDLTRTQTLLLEQGSEQNHMVQHEPLVVEDGVLDGDVLELVINNFSRPEPQVLFIKHRTGVLRIHYDISI